MKNSTLILFLLLVHLSAYCQKIDNTASYLDMGTDRYFRFLYDNDFFSASDQYYTQGYTFELVVPWLKNNPVNNLFPKLNNSTAKYGLDFEQTGFIPTDITDDEIRYGDRPYAATIALKSFIITADTLHKVRLAASLTTGMIGPAALGDEMQTGIHKWICDDLPMGWQYQIKNDVVLDYEAELEKQVFRFRDYIALTAVSRARLGTLNTNIAIGFTATAGLINAPFTQIKNKLKIYLYTRPMATLIGYDATMQGGLFNKNSPYTIPDSDIERVTLQNNFGVVMQYKHFFLEYSQALLTREFKTGSSHQWGGFKIGFGI